MKLKTSHLLLLSCLMLSLTAISLHAQPDASTVTDVRYTVHNLSNNADINLGMTADGKNYSATSTGADQVCIFCHTPHNASPSIPLWNKVYTPGVESTYKLYTSSKTLHGAAKGATITANSESMLCLSCHDGKTAINVLHNSNFRDSSTADANRDAIIDMDGTITGAGSFSLGQQWSGSFTNFNKPNLGAVRTTDGSIPSAAASVAGINLTDDHPIGFSYALAYSQDNAGLKATPDAGIRLFGSPKVRVECSSCHNPHVYYGSGLNGSTRVYYDTTDIATPLATVTATQKAKTPFLNISNTGSNLCKGCHIK